MGSFGRLEGGKENLSRVFNGRKGESVAREKKKEAGDGRESQEAEAGDGEGNVKKREELGCSLHVTDSGLEERRGKQEV